MNKLDSWCLSILADPVTKKPISPEVFPVVEGVLDARVFLRNTVGYKIWAECQWEYENEASLEAGTFEAYRMEIDYDRPVYQHFTLTGRILDCGGGAGTVREFLSDEVEFICTDPWLRACTSVGPSRKAAYNCLNQKLNFIGATAEFQPFICECFDWVHMRSMLDHVQVPDLALLEARRVLKPNGRVLIGLYVEGGREGVVSPLQRCKKTFKAGLELFGIYRWKDPHVWHPTYKNLLNLITHNGFAVEDEYWQPHWNDSVCYVCAKKAY